MSSLSKRDDFGSGDSWQMKSTWRIQRAFSHLSIFPAIKMFNETPYSFEGNKYSLKDLTLMYEKQQQRQYYKQHLQRVKREPKEKQDVVLLKPSRKNTIHQKHTDSVEK